MGQSPADSCSAPHRQTGWGPSTGTGEYAARPLKVCIPEKNKKNKKVQKSAKKCTKCKKNGKWHANSFKVSLGLFSFLQEKTWKNFTSSRETFHSAKLFPAQHGAWFGQLFTHRSIKKTVSGTSFLKKTHQTFPKKAT